MGGYKNWGWPCGCGKICKQQILAHIYAANIAYMRQYADMQIGKKWRMAMPIIP